MIPRDRSILARNSIARECPDRGGDDRGDLGRVVVSFLCFAILTGCVPVRQRTGFVGRDGGSAPSARESKKATGKTAPRGDAAGSSSGATAALSTKKTNAWEDEMEGLASWYGRDFNGHLTASGEVYDMYDMTAAHKTLPLQTLVEVHNLENGKTIRVRINDRGPYVKGRVIDLSRKAARALGMREDGTARVRLEVKKWPQKDF